MAATDSQTPLKSNPDAIGGTLPSAPHSKRRKITIEDMEAVCRLIVSRRLTETEAAALQGIRQDAWFNYKSLKRNVPRFNDILTRIRASNIDKCLTSIQNAGEDRLVGEFVKAGDWRANAWIAERVLAPERFADRKSDAPQGQPQVSVTILTTLASLAYGVHVIEAPVEPKQITNVSGSK
jgi:hypothetical protein